MKSLRKNYFSSCIDSNKWIIASFSRRFGCLFYRI